MRFRLLPVLIVTAFIALTARVGDLWQGVGSIARAQSAAPAGAAAAAANVAEFSIDPIAPKPEAPPVQDLPADPFSLTDKEINLLQALAERRRELDLRARQMEQREALLKAAERRIEEKVGGLKALQKSIQDLLLQQEDQTEGQYKSLVKIYESMKPKDAARIFEQMDMSVLLPVIERMKERKTAPILAKMNPAKANAITTQLAQRRKSPSETLVKQ
ncbi:MAG: hypothetical protein V3U23_03975 [Kiloniellales bacterium]